VHLAIIVAAARNRVIGRNNALPWHLPEDLKYFKRVTMGKPILMGRKTFESIGRPLPGRANLVVSRDPEFSAAGVSVAGSLDEAVELARDIALIDGVEELVVIGGEQIYRAALPRTQRLYLTEVHADVEGDALMPEICRDEWREMSRERHVASDANPYDYSFVVLERSPALPAL
jgi:dihydrofolate reductase